jgi:GTPase SAR1 family protein
MWDTAGSERFKSLIPTYLKNANSIILTYDITSIKFLYLFFKIKEYNSDPVINAFHKEIIERL